jgi:hypothetical protein
MQHVESSIKVYFAREYSRFRMINGNRPLIPATIRKIKQDIVNGLDVLKYCPILVTQQSDHLRIIDGQHRFWVAKELKSNVWYIIAEELDLLEIAKINNNTSRWSNNDFMNCFTQQGNTHYEKLRAFQELYDLPLSNSVKLLEFGKLNVAGMESRNFQKGTFQVKFETEAREFVEQCKRFAWFKGWKSRSFMLAIQKVIDAKAVMYPEFAERIERHKEALIRQTSFKDYLSNLEDIYNVRLKDRKRIY